MLVRPRQSLQRIATKPQSSATADSCRDGCADVNTDTANQTAVHGLRHTYGKGRVLYFAQGHDMAEFDNAQFDTGNHAFGTIIKRSIRWLAGKD